MLCSDSCLTLVVWCTRCTGEQAAEQLFSVEASGFEDNWVAFADACNLMMEAENRLQSQDTHMEEHLTGEAFAML